MKINSIFLRIKIKGSHATKGMYHHTNIVREQRAICICGESAIKKKSMRMW